MGRVHLGVADLERSLGFYTEALGFEEYRREGGVAALGAGGEELLELREHPGAGHRPKGTTGLYHYAVLVPDRASLSRSLRRLLGAGWRLWGASDHLVSEALYLDDPDGNGIEIYHDRPGHEWPWDGYTIRMDTLPLDLDGLLSETSPDGDQGLLPAGTGIGHIHLHVGDIERARVFYSDILGFDVTTLWRGTALFVSAGGYHHHVGLNTWAGADAPQAPPGNAGLERFEILVPGARELEAVSKRLEESGTRFERHDEEIRTSDPWGNGISVAAGPPIALRGQSDKASESDATTSF
jgi:catechol 2,3-dioxygenase